MNERNLSNCTKFEFVQSQINTELKKSSFKIHVSGIFTYKYCCPLSILSGREGVCFTVRSGISVAAFEGIFHLLDPPAVDFLSETIRIHLQTRIRVLAKIVLRATLITVAVISYIKLICN